MPLTPLTQLQLAPDLVDQVFKSLCNAISEGELPAGTRLTQEDIAARLAVSRQPVLQALRLLKRDGFVIDAPGRGVMVTALDATRLTQLYEIRAALDGLAARTAAHAKAKVPSKLISEGRKAAAGRSVKAMIDADLAFHRAIYAASGNPLIEESALRHWQHIRRAMGAVMQLQGLRGSTWDEHEAILQAIGKGDAKQAERLAGEHSARASTKLAALYEASTLSTETQQHSA